MNRISIAAASLLFIASVSVADLTGEHAVSTPVFAPTAVSGVIASNGDGFFEVWNDVRDRQALYASAVTAKGVVANPSGILLSRTASVSSVMWTGDSYLVVWNGATDVIGQRFDGDGNVLTSASVIVPNAYVASNHALATNGTTTVLATFGHYFVLDRDLKVIDSGPTGGQAVYAAASSGFVIAGGMTMLLDSAGRYVPRVGRNWPYPIACRASGCLTVLPSQRNNHLAVAVYDPETLIVGTPREIPLSIRQPWFDLVATGDGYGLVTADGIVQALDAAGNPAGLPVMLPAGAGSQISAASNGRDLAVVRAGPQQLLLNSIVTGNSVTHYVVGVSANAQRAVHIARGPSNYLAVWNEKDGTYAGRLSLDGVPLDGRGVLLTSDVGTASVIYDAGSYLVVVTRLSSSVIRIDPATGSVISRIAFPGTDLQIRSDAFSLAGVWIDRTQHLVAGFLYPNGALASAPITIASPSAANVFPTAPSLAWNGTVWLVAWNDAEFSPILQPPQRIPFGIRAARLSVALVPLDAQPMVITSSQFISTSRVASDGRDFLVAWSEAPSIRVRRVPAFGAPDPERQVVTGSVADLICDGAAYDVAFYTGSPVLPGDLAMAGLGPAGQPIETLVISATEDDDRSASLVAVANGRVLAAYTRVAFEQPYGGVERAFVAAPQPTRHRATR
jgi:hypothetical protein